MGIDMLSIIKDLEEDMNKALMDELITDDRTHLMIECLHNNGMRYKNILSAFLEFNAKNKKEEEE